MNPKLNKNISSNYQQGVLTTWNEDKGYGFIVPENGNEEIFLHIKSLHDDATYPIEGETFCYQIGKDKQGRIQAINAYQTNCNKKRKLSLFHRLIKLLSNAWPLVIIIYLLLGYLRSKSNQIIFLVFVVNSLLTILFYYEDKYRARFKYWRIKESVLHIWELLGGWPGALYAQYAFHHKKSKLSYMIVFALCVAINVFTLYLIYF
jgi:uncharacterized membrane protein YsdA (DUF1294 family)/cold shock CspA family protein